MQNKDLNKEPLVDNQLPQSYTSENGYAVFINSSSLNPDTESNRISTSKYQWYSFFPKMLTVIHYFILLFEYQPKIPTGLKRIIQSKVIA